MESIIVGIDVSKDRLDVAVRPSGEAFVVERNARGLEGLVARVRELSPLIVALEATGGFETVAAAALAGAGLPGHLHWHVVPRWDGDTNFMPVVADTKVIVQSLDALYDMLVNYFQR